MTKILILGAHGQIARVATDLFLKRTDARLTLYLRNARRLKISSHANRVGVVTATFWTRKRWSRPWPARMSCMRISPGQLERQTQCIVKAMERTGLIPALSMRSG
jgi:hypothetical protein